LTDPRPHCRSSALRRRTAAAIEAAWSRGEQVPALTGGKLTAQAVINQILEAQTTEMLAAANRALGDFLRGVRGGLHDRVGSPHLERRAREFGRIIRTVIRYKPNITKAELIAFVDVAWPGARGPQAKGRPLVPRAMVLAAHELLITEKPRQYNSKVACAELERRLGVDQKTIRNYLTLARRQK
jgi:hypothetical protein